MEKDILYYHKKLKRNILLVEKNKKNNKALEEVIYNFKKVYQNIKMLLISKKERYYGYFFMNLELQIRTDKEIIAGIYIEDDTFYFVTNPLFLGKYELKEITYIIAHEIEHIILNHPKEGIRLNKNKNEQTQEKLNASMDASVNDRLTKDILPSIMKMPNNSIDSKAFKKIFELPTCKPYQHFMYYYSLIKEQKEKENKLYIKKTSDDKEIITEKDAPGKFSHEWSHNDEYKEIEEITKQFVKRIYEGISEEDRDLLPEQERETINKLLQAPKINWKQVLKRYIGLIPIPYKKSRMRLNRRQPERFDLPGRLNDRTIRIVVAIDTSASMTKDIIEHIFIEIFQILKNTVFELTIIECDCQIGRVYKARRLEDINMEITGRGGTSFIPVIEYVNNNKFQDAVFIYFTDGYGDLEIPIPKTYRNIWIIMDDKENLSLENPYGEVLELEIEE